MSANTAQMALKLELEPVVVKNNAKFKLKCCWSIVLQNTCPTKRHATIQRLRLLTQIKLSPKKTKAYIAKLFYQYDLLHQP